jgi:hypothetical protein
MKRKMNKYEKEKIFWEIYCLILFVTLLIFIFICVTVKDYNISSNNLILIVLSITITGTTIGILSLLLIIFATFYFNKIFFAIMLLANILWTSLSYIFLNHFGLL